MARGKVLEFDYYELRKLLQRAGDAGQRIDKSDARWVSYVKEHGINEVAATAIALQKFEGAVPVILAEGRDSDGLYFYSKREESALKLALL
jgi:hypothetical protein